jgi:hypothetical protein
MPAPSLSESLLLLGEALGPSTSNLSLISARCSPPSEPDAEAEVAAPWLGKLVTEEKELLAD